MLSAVSPVTSTARAGDLLLAQRSDCVECPVVAAVAGRERLDHREPRLGVELGLDLPEGVV